MKRIATAVAVALSTLALSASAMTPIKDAELSAVTGQDGVSIGANLNIKIDSFVYTSTASRSTAWLPPPSTSCRRTPSCRLPALPA
jgi:hypothetical protein